MTIGSILDTGASPRAEVSRVTNPQWPVYPGSSQLVRDPRSAFPPPAVAATDMSMEFYHTLHEQAHPRMTTGGYRGAVRAEATPVAAEDNCCLFLTGFPANITMREFIHQVQTHQLGKIAAVHINPPSANHPRAAIKVTMWTRQGAVRLYNSIQSQAIVFWMGSLTMTSHGQ